MFRRIINFQKPSNSKIETQRDSLSVGGLLGERILTEISFAF